MDVINSTCRDIQQQCGGQARAEALTAATQRHLSECEACRAWLQQLRSMQAALATLSPPPLPSGFEAGLRRRLQGTESATAERHARRRARWFARPEGHVPPYVVGMAMALMVFVSIFVAQHTREPILPAETGVVLTVHAASADPNSSVTLEVSLPDGLSIASKDSGLAAARGLRWRQPTDPATTRGAPGTRVGLVATRLGRWKVLIRARSNGDEAVATVLVDVSAHGVSIERREVAHLRGAGLELAISFSHDGAPTTLQPRKNNGREHHG